MRKLAIAALVAVLLLPAAAQAIPVRDGGVDVVRLALTSFIDKPHRGAPTMYFGGAIAFNVGDDNAFVGYGPCVRKQRRGRHYWSCHASARGVPVLAPDFYMDPLLQTAHLQIRHKGFEHTIDWAGRGSPDVAYGGSVTSNTVFASNRADATGRVFGHRFSPKSYHASSFLAELVFGFVALPGMDVRVTPDGTVHVHSLVPVEGVQ
jgi:hypothetical protein